MELTGVLLRCVVAVVVLGMPLAGGKLYEEKEYCRQSF